MTARQKAYTEYLETDHWHRLRSQAIARDKCCVRCGRKKRLQAHHKIYRVTWFDTLLSDLETLCRPCHAQEHGITDQAENGQRIPKHAFVKAPEPARVLEKPDLSLDTLTMKELEKLRCDGRISRAEFKKTKVQLIANGAKWWRNMKAEVAAKRHRRDSKLKSWAESFLVKKRRWTNIGASSN